MKSSRSIPNIAPRKMLDVRNFSLTIETNNRTINALKGVDVTLNEGETLAIVGESGSGKSMLALSIIGLLPDDIKSSLSGGNLF